jgi:hypothetical protein
MGSGRTGGTPRFLRLRARYRTGGAVRSALLGTETVGPRAPDTLSERSGVFGCRSAYATRPVIRARQVRRPQARDARGGWERGPDVGAIACVAKQPSRVRSRAGRFARMGGSDGRSARCHGLIEAIDEDVEGMVDACVVGGDVEVEKQSSDRRQDYGGHRGGIRVAVGA